ncbi:MAG: alpha/beta hydrolase [Bacteroidia bacterium]|nr:alpha/beta hydrolase [Bacteroidia bacterium]
MKIGMLISVLSLAIFPCMAQQTDSLKIEEFPNLRYLSAEDVVVDSLQRLNLLIPKGVNNPPLLVWIGGGAWSFVNRHQEMALARKFAQNGIAVASVGHRLSKGSFADTTRKSGVQHPEHIKDVAAAFKWLYEQAGKYGYDQKNMFVSGFSSGAHLAALLGMDPSYLKKHGLKTTDIKAIIPVAGTYDIVDYYSVFKNHETKRYQKMAETHVMDVFGETENDFIQASPATYLDKLKIPMLLISEGGLFNYTKLFEEKIWESEYRQCQILHLLNFSHGGLWTDMSYAENSQARNAMTDFIHRESKVEKN